MWCYDRLTYVLTNIIAVCLCLLIKINYWPMKLSDWDMHLSLYKAYSMALLLTCSAFFYHSLCEVFLIWTVISCLCFRWSLLSFNAHNEDLSRHTRLWYTVAEMMMLMMCVCVCSGLWCDVKWWWQLPVCLSLPQRNHSWPWKVRDPVPSNISTVIDLSASDVIEKLMWRISPACVFALCRVSSRGWCALNHNLIALSC